MLDLIRLSPHPLFPPGGVDLYRQIAILAELSEGQEVLDVASGRGIPLEYFVREYGVVGAGVEESALLVEEAENRARDEELASRLQFQTGRPDALPYRDHIFDVVVGELGLAAHCDPGDAVRELVRVTKPGGTVALVQLVWKAPVDEPRRKILSAHLGARPMMMVEWKRLLRDAGVRGVHVEDWSAEETSFRPRIAKPFPDFAEIFSLSEKIGILRRAWSRWGWRGVRTVLEREREVHRLLTSERILGLNLIKGQKHTDVPEAETSESEPSLRPERSGSSAPSRSSAPSEGDEPSGHRGPSEDTENKETAGLPLFGPGEGT